MASRAARVLRAHQQLATAAPTVRYPDVYYVYVLRSLRDGKQYTGYSSNLRNRIAAHGAGSVQATRQRRPLQLIYYEAYLLAKDARAREVFLKSGSGKRYIREQMSHYFSASET